MNQPDKTRKSYHTPKLEIHGELSSLTQQISSVGGSPYDTSHRSYDPSYRSYDPSYRSY